jgi:hypothetical protein
MRCGAAQWTKQECMLSHVGANPNIAPFRCHVRRTIDRPHRRVGNERHLVNGVNLDGCFGQFGRAIAVNLSTPPSS